MTHIPAPAEQHLPGITSRRSVTVRRYAVRALRRVVQFSDIPFTAAALAMAIMWAAHAGPAWITGASDWLIMLYGILIYGANRIVDALAETAIDLIDPDRWDGDVAYELANGLTELRADIDSGADIDDVLDSLRSSNLVPELLATLRALGAGYAARGDEDENQRLLAAVLHLRNADQYIGYGSELDALEAGGTFQKHPQ
ncbi:hypothetical protein HRW14_08860 [Streptomyces lunaelactis]|uniref:hypothetical protein n=1 Tax=Streptomyces lunaelactis TaxID=1535768 RepID=UPI0015850A7B|nr:hypothetical protein [Streptomyces lunaelactis]NUK50398.1 hypothetical protein [Streptomyces lunaelactis]